MDFFDIDIESIRREMAHEPTAEEQLEHRVDFIIRELDDLCGMALDPKTKALVKTQAIAIGQIHFRAALALEFLGVPIAPPQKLKVISR